MLAVALAITGGYLSRFHLMPHDPAAAVNRVLRHLRHRVRRVLSDIGGASLSGDGERRDPARFGRQLARLREAALLAKEQIDALAKEGDLDRVRRQAATHLLGVELGIERLVRLPLAGAPSATQRDYLRHRLARLQQLLAGSGSEIGQHQPPACSDRLRVALDLLERAVLTLPPNMVGAPAASDSLPSSAQSNRPNEPGDGELAGEKPAGS
jgi:hypothetical protein